MTNKITPEELEAWAIWRVRQTQPDCSDSAAKRLSSIWLAAYLSAVLNKDNDEDTADMYMNSLEEWRTSNG